MKKNILNPAYFPDANPFLKTGIFLSFRQKIFYIAGIFLFLLAHCKAEPQLAKESVLILSRTSGSVEINRAGASIPISPGTLVVSGDTISTGPGAFADLEFPGGALLRVKEKSKVAIDQVLIRGDLNVGMEVAKGKVHIKIKEKLKPNETFRVKTPTMVAGVRGTEFSVSETDAKIMVLEGTVSASGESTEKQVSVEGGNKAMGEEIEVSALTEPEKKELMEDSNSLAGIGESVREVALKNLKQIKEENALLLNDQINSNKAYLDDQKNRDREAIEDQKKRDRDALEGQKAGDNEKLNDQKNRDSGNLSDRKDTDKLELDDTRDKGAADLRTQKNKSNEMGSIKKDAGSEKSKILDSKKDLESMKKSNSLESVKPGK